MKDHFFDIAKFPSFEKSNWVVLSHELTEKSTIETDSARKQLSIPDAISLATLNRLPFERTSFLAVLNDSDIRFAISIVKRANSDSYNYRVLRYHPRHGVSKLLDVDLLNVESEPKYALHGGLTDSRGAILLTSTLAWIAGFMASVNNYEIATRVPKECLKNANRIARGFAPVEFEWKVAKIETSKTKSKPQGGTHASPRYHKRRGHIRRLKSGKTIFIKECFAGDINKGFIAKEYQI